MTTTNIAILRELTRLDLQMNMTTDSLEYNELERECYALLCKLDVPVVTFEHEGKYGLRTEDLHNGSQIIVEPIYDSIFDDDFAATAVKDGHWYLLYGNGKIEDIEVECDELLLTNTFDLFKGRVGSRWGLYDKGLCQWVASPIYDEIQEEHTSFLLRSNAKYGLYAHGSLVEAIYDRVLFCRTAGYVGFYKKGELGFIDARGQWTSNLEEAVLWLEPY